MQRGLWLLVLGVVAAALGVASARAAATATTTTGTTTTTTTTTTLSYAPLALSSLSARCLGAGAGALVPPSHPVIALGTPASNLGPSAYRTASGTVLSFASSTASGSSCQSAQVTLSSVSLFGGAVTASSVQARDGRGTAVGIEIDRSAVTAAAGEKVPVEDWGQLTLGATIGRTKAPLVLRLLRAHDGLPAGTAVEVAFAASAQPAAKPKRTAKQPPDSAPSPNHSRDTKHAKKHRRQGHGPPPDYPAAPSPFTARGEFTDAVRDNPIVATALKYLGVRYQWGGASPKTGFDCSGFVQYVFAQLGVPLIHYAAAQWHSPAGVWVAPNRLQPGDLVFFTGADGTRKSPGHVGIYLDDGYIIDAPHTGTFVRIDSLKEPKLANDYVGARRIETELALARHLSHANKGGASAPAVPLNFPPPMMLASYGGPLGLVAARTTGIPSAPRDHWIWAGATLGGLLLVLGSGALALRHRRRRPEAAGEVSN